MAVLTYAPETSTIGRARMMSPAARQPVLATARFDLVPFTVGDESLLRALYVDCDVTRYLGPTTAKGTFVEAQVGRWVGLWAQRGYGPCWVVARQDGDVLGRCGLHDAGKDGVAELGIVLARRSWSSGVGPECAAATITWAQCFGVQALTAFVDERNERCRRLLRRLGFSLDPSDQSRSVGGVDTWRLAL